MKKYKVNTISEYLSIIEKLGLNNFIYRGQNEPYHGISSNGFRSYKGGWTTDKIYNIDIISKDFYRQIVRNISSEERQYFLAFCQHYGIPTNLIDFTYSPLISLFFACQGKQKYRFTIEELIHSDSFDNIEKLKNEKSTQNMLIQNLINRIEKDDISPCAQVYLLEKKRLIDVTDIIKRLGDKNFLDCLVTDGSVRSELINKLIVLFTDLNSLKDISTYLINLIECYKNNNADIYRILNNIQIKKLCKNKSENLFTFIEKLKNEPLEDVICDLYCYIRNEIDDENIYYEIDSEYYFYKENSTVDNAAAVYTLLLANLIEISGRFNEKLFLDLDVYFTYQPPEIFTRISFQQGLFIYQPYIYKQEPVYQSNILSLQKINPSIVIEIENYEDILKDIDILGINLGSIYGDLDNIASATVERYKRENNL